MQKGVLPSYADASAAETIIVDIAKFFSEYGYIAALGAGVILAGILASTMSTADSQLLAAASSVSQNLLQETFGIKMSAKTSMLVARISVIAISVVAIFLAWDPNSSVFRIVSFAWAGFGGAFGPLMLCALFWKRTTKAGAISGVISGGLVVFIYKWLRDGFESETWLSGGFLDGTIFDIYELLPAFIVGVATIIIVSLLTKKPEKEIVDTFDEVKSLCKTK